LSFGYCYRSSKYFKKINICASGQERSVSGITSPFNADPNPKTPSDLPIQKELDISCTNNPIYITAPTNNNSSSSELNCINNHDQEAREVENYLQLGSIGMSKDVHLNHT